jgi:NAD(P)-dependent dehydrogenase (short-subunit alcohol dehydrogenase family)
VTSPERPLDGRVALVTGGGTGIGLAIASRYATAGADVVLVGRRESVLREAAAQIESGSGARALVHAGDVRDEAVLDGALDAAWSGLGRLDVLVNNAGGQFIAPAELISRRGWAAVIDVDLNATFYWSQRAARRWMEAKRGGAILNIVGPFRDRATAGMVHSGAARAGVVHMARTLAVEWAPFGIRVNNIGPAVLTDGMRAEFAAGSAAVVEDLERRLPTGRWGTPREIGEVALFLASDAAAYITGETLVMDGAVWSAEGLGMRPPSSRRWVDDPDSERRRDWAGPLLDAGEERP